MRKQEKLERLEQALEDEAELPRRVYKRVRAYNSDTTDVSAAEMTEKIEKKATKWWILVLIVLAVAYAVAKWKGLI